MVSITLRLALTPWWITGVLASPDSRPGGEVIGDVLDAPRVGDLVGRDEGLDQIESDPRLLLEHVAPHHRLVIDRDETGLLVKADAFGDRVGEQIFKVRDDWRDRRGCDRPGCGRTR